MKKPARKKSSSENVKEKIVKPNNISTKSSATSKNDSEWDEYLSTFSFQMCPANNQFYERLAIEIVTWAREDDRAYCLEEFYDIKGILEKDFHRFMVKCEKLREAHGVAKMIIASRRETGALEKRLSEGMVRFTMPMYRKSWADREKEFAALSIKEETAPTKIEVIMQNYGDAKCKIDVPEESRIETTNGDE